jgi:hypothetical protein
MATEIRIFDLTGKLVSSHAAGSNSFSIDITDLQPGQYIMHLDTETGHEVSEFIKL